MVNTSADEYASSVQEESIQSDEFHSTVETSEPEDDDHETLTADNTNRVARRSTRTHLGIPPIWYTNPAKISSYESPTSYNEAIRSADRDKWIAAMKDEYNSLKDFKTWDLTELPKGKKAIGNKCVFKIKNGKDGKIRKFKARLVAKGFSQKYGEDYDEVFAPVVKQTTLRILLSIAAKEEMIVKHFDVKTAFLNGTVDETIYMKQPEGFIEEGQESIVCLVKRSIYGLKQAARCWNLALNEALGAAQFYACKADPCLYIKCENEDICYILVYVDDLIVASKSANMIKQAEEAIRKFKVEDLGDLGHYLGIEITKNDNGNYLLTQVSYINEIIANFHLESSKASPYPLDPNYYRWCNGDDQERLQCNANYRKLIGNFLYLSVNTRFDIAASVSILARKVESPKQGDWNELKRVVKYLKGTKHHALELGNKTDEILCADADWAEDRTDRKPNSGFIFFCHGSPIIWSCKKQTCISQSSCEAEYISLSDACREAEWLIKLFDDFHYPVNLPIKID